LRRRALHDVVAVGVDAHDLAGLDLAHQLGADGGERAALRRQHMAAARQLADFARPEAGGVDHHVRPEAQALAAAAFEDDARAFDRSTAQRAVQDQRRAGAFGVAAVCPTLRTCRAPLAALVVP